MSKLSVSLVSAHWLPRVGCLVSVVLTLGVVLPLAVVGDAPAVGVASAASLEVPLISQSVASDTDDTATQVIWYRDYEMGDYGSIDLPVPPEGVHWIKIGASKQYLSNEEIDGDQLEYVSMALLGSDGFLRGAYDPLHQQVESISSYFQGKQIADFWMNKDYGYIEWLLFRDGQIANVRGINTVNDPTYNPFSWQWESTFPPLPAGLRYTRILSPTLLLRSDGRAVLRQSGTWSWWNTPKEVLDGYVTKGSNFVDGATGEYAIPLKHGGKQWGEYGQAAVLLRTNGAVSYKLMKQYFDRPDSIEHPKWNKRNLATQLQKLPTTVRYRSITNAGKGVVLLRRDDKLTYLGMVDYLTDPPQPPKPPLGLHYTELLYQHSQDDLTDNERDYRGKRRELALIRSDGNLLVLKCQRHEKQMDSKCAWDLQWHGDDQGRGWQFVSLARGSSTDAYIYEKITTKSASGIASATTKYSKTKINGKRADVRVKIATQGVWSGGILKITYNGKAICRTKISGPGNYADVRINPKALRKGRNNRIVIQYLGNGQTKKSVKAAFNIVV